MNMNTWHVEELAELNRSRVRDEMRQIRLEESAARSGKSGREGPQLNRPKHLRLIQLAMVVLRELMI